MMRNLQSILLPTDFFPSSEEACNAAVRLSTLFGSHVTLLHVVETFPHWPFEKHYYLDQATLKLERWKKDLAERQVPVAESEVLIGSPAETIVRRARELNTDLVIVGAGERDHAEQFRLGAVAEAVVHHAPQPVLAVRPGAPALEFRKIVCPVDFSAVARRGLENAVRMAKLLSSEIVVLSVVPLASKLAAIVEVGVSEKALADHEREWHQSLDEFLAPIDFGSVHWSKEVRRGAPHEGIITAVKEHQADLLVMGSSGRSGLARVIMGSVARRVLQDLPCSLLVVKGEDVLPQQFEEDLRTRALLMAEAREFEAAGQYASAAYKYGQALAIDPFYVPALVARGEMCAKIGDQVEAARMRGRAEAILMQADDS